VTANICKILFWHLRSVYLEVGTNFLEILNNKKWKFKFSLFKFGPECVYPPKVFAECVRMLACVCKVKFFLTSRVKDISLIFQLNFFIFHWGFFFAEFFVGCFRFLCLQRGYTVGWFRNLSFSKTLNRKYYSLRR